MNNIILIGFMGSGKSTMGRYMEEYHEYKLIDTDEYIEKWQSDSISNIFSTKGEAYFRELETECIKKLIDSKTENTVISVGGGLPIKSDNQKLLKELGKVVYLRAGVDTLVNRLMDDDKRPLLQGGDLRNKITELMAKRESTYETLADVIIDTDGCTTEQIFKSIEEKK